MSTKKIIKLLKQLYKAEAGDSEEFDVIDLKAQIKEAIQADEESSDGSLKDEVLDELYHSTVSNAETLIAYFEQLLTNIEDGSWEDSIDVNDL